tara:strand:+ start:153 stop:422 length:270 start_codon:yes stop_codon:yes gene_type:complete
MMLDVNQSLLIILFIALIISLFLLINYNALSRIFKKCETPQEFYQTVEIRKQIHKDIGISSIFGEKLFTKIIFQLKFKEPYKPENQSKD